MHPGDALRTIAQPFEEAARVGEFMRARSAKASVADGILASQNVTVNFQQIGGSMQALAHMTAFLNPAIQSMDRFMRTMARPVQRGLREGPGAFAREAVRVYGTAAGAIALPSAILWAVNRNDQEIADLRKTNAGLIFWFVRAPNGTILRIPKPFLWGQVFGTGMESALDAFRDQDPDAAERWAEGVADQLSTQVKPNFLRIAELATAEEPRDPFFGTPVIPPELEGVAPALQARETTGLIARKLGQRFNVSPARIEAVWREATGTLGSEILKAADRAAERLIGADVPTIEPLAADAPVFGRLFARVPSTNVQPMREFYEQANRSSEAMRSIGLLEKAGDAEAYRRFLEQNFRDFALGPIYEGVRQQFADIRNDIEFYTRLPDSVVSPADKRRITNDLIRQMVETARIVNNVAGRTP